MENDILTKKELINYLYFVFIKDRQSIEKFNDKYKYNFLDNLYIKKSTNKSVELINNTLDKEFINLAKDNSEDREILFCIDILIKIIYKYNFNINIFEESKRENVIDIYKFYIYNSLKNESKEFCCVDSNDISKHFVRLNLVDCFKVATIDLYIGFLDLLLLKEITDINIHNKEVTSFHFNLDILINEIPNLKIYEYNENPLPLINRIVYPKIKHSELLNISKINNKKLELENESKDNSKANTDYSNLVDKNKEILLKIHTLVTDKEVIDCNISEFLQAISNADLSGIRTKKTVKRNYLIYRLSEILNDKWYTQICENMNLEKGRCSGGNVKNDYFFYKEIKKLTTKSNS
ncbi:MAG: hypothetical protein H6Q16_870 [Bacteroidetes bacterium]|nr:hypothetical protein [Bacteroidota bacterium]